MAYKISAHKTLANAKTIFEGFSSSGVDELSDLARSNFVTSGSKHLLEQYKMIGKLCNQIEVDLTDAQRDSGFLAGKWNVPGSNKKTYNKTSINKKHTIDVDVDAVNITLDLMNSSRSKLDDVYNSVCKAYNEISGLETMNLEIGILTVIETMTFLPPVSSSANILKNNILRNLNDVKRNLSKVSSFFGGSNYVSSSCGTTNVIAATRTSLQKILACEEKAKRIPYQNNIDACANVNENTDMGEVRDDIRKLEHDQAEYYALYGKKCPEIEEELARLKKLYEGKASLAIDLNNDFNGKSMKQGDYRLPSYGHNVGCCATAYAIGLSILGEDYNPEDLATGSGACTFSVPGNDISEYKKGTREKGAAFFGEDEVNSNLVRIYENLKNGGPTLLCVEYDGGEHWILVTGIRDGVEWNNARIEDFDCIDPYYGTKRTVGDVTSEYGGFISYAAMMGNNY